MSVTSSTADRVASYPLAVTVPVQAQRRWTAVVRPLLALPAVVFSLLLNVGAALAVWAAAVVAGRVPRWLFDFQLSVLRWHARSAAYLLLLTDVHPPLDGAHPVGCDLAPPGQVARRKVLVWKLITAFPHALVLVVLTAVLVPVWLAGWIAATTTGRLPSPVHAYVTGVLAWWVRLAAYVQSLTDDFPPFSLQTTPAPARPSAYVASSAIGLVPATLITAFATFIVGFSGTHVTVDVPYQQLQAGSVTSGTTAQVESGLMSLVAVTDPADDALALLTPAAEQRFVAFDISIRNWRGAGETVPVGTAAFQLTDDAGSARRPIMVAVDRTPGSGAIAAGRTGTATIVFEIPTDAQPQRLTWDVIDYISIPRRGETIDWIFR